jgi:hypothetical protein
MSNTVIELRHSYVTGNVPTSLANGEIAINTYDGKIFYRGGPSNTIQTIERYEGPAGLDTEIQFNDSGVLGSSPRLTFDRTTGLFRTGNVTANTVATRDYIQFGDGSRQYTANAGSGGGGSPLTVSLTDDSNVFSNVVTNVTGIRFDANSGFDVTNLGSGNVKIAMNSTFKTWKIAGQNDLIANGLDTIAFVASNGISITSNTLANPKSITFDGGRIFNHANAAFNAANTGGGSGSNLIKTFNVLSDFSAPVPGKAIFVPEATNTIRSVRLTNGGPVDRNLTAGLYKNDVLLQYFTLPMGQFTVKYSDLNYAIITTDYIKVSIIEGIGSNFSMTLFNT